EPLILPFPCLNPLPRFAQAHLYRRHRCSWEPCASTLFEFFEHELRHRTPDPGKYRCGEHADKALHSRRNHRPERVGDLRDPLILRIPALRNLLLEHPDLLPGSRLTWWRQPRHCGRQGGAQRVEILLRDPLYELITSNEISTRGDVPSDVCA